MTKNQPSPDVADLVVRLRKAAELLNNGVLIQAPNVLLREAADALDTRDRWQPDALRAVFTNEVIRAIGALARQQEVCREQDGKTVFVTGMEAAREYLIEHVLTTLPAPPSEAP